MKNLKFLITSLSFCCIYVVNMDAAGLQKHDTVDDFGTYFLVVKEVGAHFGVLYHEGDKSMSLGALGKTLGCQNDMMLKTTRPLIKKVWMVMGQTIWLMGDDDRTLKDIEMLAVPGFIWFSSGDQ